MAARENATKQDVYILADSLFGDILLRMTLDLRMKMHLLILRTIAIQTRTGP